MTMRPLLIALAALVSVSPLASAQTPVCTTDTTVYHALKPFIDKSIAAGQPVITAAVASKSSSSEVAAPSTTSAATTATSSKLVTTKSVCTALRTAVADRETRYSQGVNLKKSYWTFLEVGNYYGVHLETRLDPGLGVVANQRAPFYLFTKDARPRYIKLMYF